MNTSWKNWSGSQEHSVNEFNLPESESDVIQMMDRAASAGQKVRAIGSAHSFVPFWTNDTLVSLDKMKGVTEFDKSADRVTLWAGTKLHEIGPAIWPEGYSMTNMGDIDRQSIAGAIGTGTHGTGRTLRNISSQVVGARIVKADGDVVDLSEADGDVFQAAKISMGLLGVVTQVTLQVEPAYHLVERNWTASVAECGEQLEQLIADNRHFEFFWDPASDTCAMKTLNQVEAGYEEEGAEVGASHEIIPSQRDFEFNEIEFSVAYDDGWRCFLELRELMKQKYPKVRWPVEYRTLAPDDSLLSSAYQRESVTISAHESNRIDHVPFFLDAENLFRAYSGRPHWGKVHTQDHAELSVLLPEFNRFCEIRQAFDPEGRFLNPFLSNVVGTN